MKNFTLCSALLGIIILSSVGCDDNLTESVPNSIPGTISPKNVTVTTYAGTGDYGFLNGPRLQARFYYPMGLSAGADGSLYIADTQNQQVRKISPEGIVSTVNCHPDGGGTLSLQNLGGVVVSAEGILYIANANTIYKLLPSGRITVFAGGEEKGYEDGQGKLAKFNQPAGLALGSDGTLYVADELNHRIRKITPQGLVSTVAGSENGFEDGTALNAKFAFPTGITVGNDGTLFVADMGNHRIRKISSSGVVSTLAGSEQGFEDGTGGNAKFYHPHDLTTAPDGSLYIADSWNNSIRRISTEGVVSTIARDFSFPEGITFHDGHLFVSDYTHRIFQVDLE
ncbi:hypothetical protein GZH53_09950 [Flavihumibacter sp. R14]|nr:hypothetical protein [Flavihumibacter soli]